jgi:hypothetical protein
MAALSLPKRRAPDHVKRVGDEVVVLDCGHWVQGVPEFTGILTGWLERTSGR